MTTLDLHALRGNDPLGFLAAVGLLEIVTIELQRDARLAWSPDSLAGRLEVHGLNGISDLSAELVSWARSLKEADTLLSPHVPGLPLKPSGISGSDPMRLHPDAARAQAEAAAVDERAGQPHRARWFGALVNQAAYRNDSTDQVALTPFYAPSGKQSVYSMFEKPLKEVAKEPSQLEAALVQWRRVQGYAGAGLDHRAERDATVRSDADKGNFGAPGPEWLALMGLPLYRLTGDGLHGGATLWQRYLVGRRWRRAMVWPVWEHPLDHAAVRCLLEHPILRLDQSSTTEARPGLACLSNASAGGGEGALRALGVVAVFLSTRRALGKSEGPLGPAMTVWES